MIAFLRFGTIGAFAAGLQLVAFTVLDRFGLPDLVSGTIAYCIGTATHFLLNRVFTFHASSSISRDQLFRYAMLLGLNYLVTMICIWLAADVLRQPAQLGILASLLITVLNSFFVMKHFVFRE